MRILPGCAQKNIFGKTKQTNKPTNNKNTKQKEDKKKQKHTKHRNIWKTKEKDDNILYVIKASVHNSLTFVNHDTASNSCWVKSAHGNQCDLSVKLHSGVLLWHWHSISFAMWGCPRQL